ncbi:hypothetical protein PVAND_010405 [Polypedilum vanderplanki]|uniref:Uncharacterized protein n=1 Tax=Polypedilum vanderplanki TaxID=319348 RepID=A0A9J6CFF8_POLVA|nr:hypothetical protein PVAND_010405 [Polypedilum vanderplanki]
MNFNLPVYINYNKFLLVEEIALNENPALIHYGKCTVIGFLSNSNSIQSISIPKIKSENQLADGVISLRIYIDKHLKEYINCTVQIYGEVRLYNSNQDIELKNFESSYSLIHKLRELQTKLETEQGLKPREPSGTNDKRMSFETKFKLEKEIVAMKQQYKPIVLVYDIKHQSVARELIVENLFYRQIRKKKARLKN